MSNHVRINMLGGFTIAYGSNVISDQDNRSKKVWTLLEYLIAFHTELISHDALLELLWPCAENRADSENALKTILHRARTLLDALEYPSEKLILHRKECYRWNPAVPFILDTELFTEYCEAASNAALPLNDRLSLYAKAFALYKGRFLPRNANDDWVIPVSDQLHAYYLNAVHEAITLLLSLSQYSEVIKLCRQASLIDPHDEIVRYHLIRSLHLIGNQKDALDEYHHVMQLFYDTYGVNPSDEITALYRDITKESQPPTADLSAIKESLREQNAKQCAYFCDFSIFQNLYHIEARSAVRNGLSVFLCLISLTAAGNTDNTKMALAMHQMQETIGQSLRAGDVYSRYSVNQYIIMLTAANYENCTAIGARIIKGFQLVKPKINITADYTLSELEPIQFS